MEEHKPEHHAAHEHHAHETTEHHSEQKGFKIRKEDLWKSLTVIFGILLVISLIFNFRGGGVSSSMGKDTAVTKAIGFVNTNLLQPGTTASVGASEDLGSIYKMEMSIGAQKYTSYVTKDGKYLFPSGIELEKSAETLPQQPSEPTQPTQNAVKSDKPKAEAFVFSYCPYGTQFEKAMLPVYNLLKNKADLNIVFIGAMHGEYEKVESLRQICVQKIYGKDKLWSYLEKFLGDAKMGQCGGDQTCSKPLIEAIFPQIGIDGAKVNDCMAKDAEVLYNADVSKSNSAGVSGSPTFAVNGVQSRVARSPEAIKQAICSAFATAPEECKQALSNDAATPGFGFGTGGSASSAANCGV